MAYERFRDDTGKVSRNIDSIILNGLIKCILNNTKLEKKEERLRAPQRVLMPLLENVVTHSILPGDTIVISPHLAPCLSVMEPSVNTVWWIQRGEFRI